MGQENEPATRRDLNRLETRVNDVEKRLTTKIDGVDQRLTNVEKRLSAKIDANAAKIDANAAKIDAVDQRLTDVEKRLSAKIEANGAAISRIAVQVVENKEEITRLTAKVDKFDGYFNRIITTLDGLAADYARVDQERAATNARLDRVEVDVDKNKRDIKEIKTKLAMS